MAAKNPAPETMTPKPVDVNVLAEHYQKTFEVAFDTWKERNRMFVALVLTAGVGLMILLRVPTADALLVAAVTKFLNITDEATRNSLQAVFPFNILLSGILVVMFYLMQRLYSTNLSVMREYLYLGALEEEIRNYLGLPKGSVFFTREGSFYWGQRTFMQSMSKYYYVVVLFFVLAPFIIIKLINDFQSPSLLVIPVDILVALMTILYWWEYARASFRMDVPKMEKPKE